MKNYKIYLIVIIFCLCNISCSKEDDTVVPIQDNFETKLIGTWQFHKMVENGEVVEMGPCISQTTYEFLKDGTMMMNLLLPDEMNNGECDTITQHGKWEMPTENTIKTTVNGEITVEEIVFSEDNTVFSVTTEYDDGMIETLSLIKIK